MTRGRSGALERDLWGQGGGIGFNARAGGTPMPAPLKRRAAKAREWARGGAGPLPWALQHTRIAQGFKTIYLAN